MEFTGSRVIGNLCDGVDGRKKMKAASFRRDMYSNYESIYT